ncbi:helicase-exonuclease AddAB subunit AddA [Leuconostocaceae bacterium ESL0958]|nr:helicase-exonuclease AddAB subunit AddA [Leuconostocaceae bacterium ESL0958]
MPTSYTEHQQSAIDQHGHNILVSASAGSGKTTVLIERLIRKIMDQRQSVDQFLIVTFTRAAADSMKRKLEEALQKELAQADDAKTRAFVQEQLTILPTANVTTIDSFALSLIERYYYLIDLDPAFRLVADSAEVALLQNQVLDDLFQELYAVDHPHHEALMTAVHNFAKPSADGPLQEIVLKLANFALARPEEDHWLQSLLDQDSQQPLQEQARYQGYLAEQVRPLIQEALADAERAMAYEDHDQSLLAKAAAALAERRDYLQQIDRLLSMPTDYDDLRQAFQQSFSSKFPARPSAKKIAADETGDLQAQAEQLEHFLTFKDRYFANQKAPLQQVIQRFFRLTEAQWQDVNQRGAAVLTALVTVTEDYLAALAEQKRADNILHFSDLVFFARQILKHDQVQQLVQAQFSEVMVDEYQDVNRLQEAFLQDLTTGDNFYMVGDIKQSIYGFRQAAPQLFAAKYRRFQEASNDDELIELADNFRSENNVTTVINQLFTQLMDQELGDVAYAGSAKLVAKAPYPAIVQPVVQLDLLEIARKQSAGAANADDSEDGPDQAPDKREKANRYLLAKIKTIMAEGTVYDRQLGTNRPVRFSDIAILTRGKGGYPDLLRLAHEAQIPIQSDSVGNYYQVLEVYLMLDLLRVIDNPHRDIPLAAVLRSPMVGLDENELAAIRLADQQHDFWTAFQRYAAAGNEKAQKFLAHLQGWRLLAQQNDLVGLIWQIYQDTDWLNYVAGLPGGLQRQSNLHALYQKAAAFQEKGQAGLYAFIRYVVALQEGATDVGEVAQDSAAEAISLMTIHKSKGLEFPIVILPDLDKAFNQQDQHGSLLIHREAGLGLDYREPNAQVNIPTLSKFVVQEAIKKQAWSEEMRLYYVALTRAEQQLYLLGQIDPLTGEQLTNAERVYQTAARTSGQFLPVAQRLGVNSYLDWTLQAFARLHWPALDEALLGEESLDRADPSAETPQNGQVTVQIVAEEKLAALAREKPVQTAAKQPLEADQTAIDWAALQKQLAYRYPHEQATRTAAYQSVSEIKRLFEDPDEGQMAALTVDEQGHFNRQFDANQAEGDASQQPTQLPEQVQLPAAQAYALTSTDLPLPDLMANQPKQVSATAVGSATHLLLQFVDFGQESTEASLKAALAELVAAGKVDEAVAAEVKLDQVLAFLRTDFAATIASHQATLFREAPFAMLMPAKQVYTDLDDETPILIHGIIDGYFIDRAAKTITLFDYKTDYLPKGGGRKAQAALAAIKSRYRGQVNLYRQALQDQYPDYQVQEARLVLLAATLVVTCQQETD